MVATGLTYPSDLIRRKVQLGGLVGAPKYKNTLDCIRQVYQQKSLRGFYTGMTPSLIKIVPTMAISFMVYEKVMRVLGELYYKDDQEIRGGL